SPSTVNILNNEGKDYILYGTITTNTWKLRILFDEMELSYKYEDIDIFNPASEKRAEFKKIFPNGKVPALMDFTLSPPQPVFESGAILLYIASKHGKFLPDIKTHPREHSDVLQWLAWQISGLGPMHGQYVHYALFAQDAVPAAEERYYRETDRLYSVLDKHLEGKQWIAANQYSIADMAVYAWAMYLPYGFVPNHEKFTNVLAWLDRMNQRPVLAKLRPIINHIIEEDVKHLKAVGTYRVKA
ncbi:hypothetical protein SAMD00019534_042850, partial [Acytostelium subglobosum LB1]|uniref:hypothetical protein n=1 Tax=Acytostelium subglobosum LB1 TaxID=1410327 RepID=UPI000644918E